MLSIPRQIQGLAVIEAKGLRVGEQRLSRNRHCRNKEMLHTSPLLRKRMVFLNFPLLLAVMLAIVAGTKEDSPSAAEISTGQDYMTGAVILFLFASSSSTPFSVSLLKAVSSLLFFGPLLYSSSACFTPSSAPSQTPNTLTCWNQTPEWKHPCPSSWNLLSSPFYSSPV